MKKKHQIHFIYQMHKTCRTEKPKIIKFVLLLLTLFENFLIFHQLPKMFSLIKQFYLHMLVYNIKNKIYIFEKNLSIKNQTKIYKKTNKL